MNGYMGDIATERDVMSILVDLGFTAEEILYVLFGVNFWLIKIKGSEEYEWHKVHKKEMQNLQARIGCKSRILEEAGFGVQGYIQGTRVQSKSHVREKTS